MLSYGQLTIDFGIVGFAKTRWLFSYGVTFLPDARGDMCFILSASLSVVRPTDAPCRCEAGYVGLTAHISPSTDIW